jgi:hypothetical protein
MGVPPPPSRPIPRHPPPSVLTQTTSTFEPIVVNVGNDNNEGAHSSGQGKADDELNSASECKTVSDIIKSKTLQQNNSFHTVEKSLSSSPSPTSGTSTSPPMPHHIGKSGASPQKRKITGKNLQQQQHLGGHKQTTTSTTTNKNNYYEPPSVANVKTTSVGNRGIQHNNRPPNSHPRTFYNSSNNYHHPGGFERRPHMGQGQQHHRGPYNTSQQQQQHRDQKQREYNN